MNAEQEIVDDDALQTCMNCGESLRLTRRDLVFEHDDLTIIVKDVPMAHCDACGEQYVPGPIGLEISDAVDHVVREARRQRATGSHYLAREVVLSEEPLTAAGSK
jgi:YgiT-type zinc finger domain-containing protein